MCQLLGMNANTPTDAMFSFTGLATRADEHKDGFGIAFFEDRGLRLFVDQHSARTSPVAELVQGLESQYDAAVAHDGENLLAEGEEMPTADELAAQFEQFLAEQNGSED